MSNALITDQESFEELCDHIRQCGLVAFDTEFISDDTYRPLLALLQFATDDRVAAVDPFAVSDLTPWWSIMADDQTRVVVHGGQAEIRFCLLAHADPPRTLHDIQLAEGLLGRSFPMSYSNLVRRVMRVNASSKQTRTDWKRRPLSKQQIDYALDDVRYVLDIYRDQLERLTARGRESWIEVEMERMVNDEVAEIAQHPVERVSGIHRLTPRELAIARELAEWREREGQNRDRLVRRVLRDDLVIDIARRQPKTLDELLANRDMNRGGYRRSCDDILACVQRGRQFAEADLPPVRRDPGHNKARDAELVGKFLSLVLANRCAEVEVSTQLVATSSDLQQLVLLHVFGESVDPPQVTQGWRAEVCGDLLIDVLAGRISMRVANARSDKPFEFHQR